MTAFMIKGFPLLVSGLFQHKPILLGPSDRFPCMVYCLAGFLFCIWNLHRGVRTGKTWHRAVSGDIDRRTHPANFWVAIFFWALGALACILVMADQFAKYLQRQ